MSLRKFEVVWTSQTSLPVEVQLIQKGSQFGAFSYQKDQPHQNYKFVTKTAKVVINSHYKKILANYIFCALFGIFQMAPRLRFTRLNNLRNSLPWIVTCILFYLN